MSSAYRISVSSHTIGSEFRSFGRNSKMRHSTANGSSCCGHPIGTDLRWPKKQWHRPPSPGSNHKPSKCGLIGGHGPPYKGTVLPPPPLSFDHQPACVHQIHPKSEGIGGDHPLKKATTQMRIQTAKKRSRGERKAAVLCCFPKTRTRGHRGAVMDDERDMKNEAIMP